MWHEVPHHVDACKQATCLREVVLHEGKLWWMLGVLNRLCMRNLVGRNVG